MNVLTANTTALYIASGLVTFIAIVIAYRFISRRQYRNLQARIDDDACAEQSVAKARASEHRDADADDERESSSEDGGGDADDRRVPGDGSPKKDPIEFCDHIQSEMKKARQAAVVKNTIGEMTSEEKETERETQRKQLEAIFKMMAEQNEKFGVNSMDQIQEQMKLYA